jgi:hypothetical protein
MCVYVQQEISKDHSNGVVFHGLIDSNNIGNVQLANHLQIEIT